MCADVLLLVGLIEGVRLAQGWLSLAWPCSLIPPFAACCRQQPCTPTSAASMETDSKEAAMEGVGQLALLAEAASTGVDDPLKSAAAAAAPGQHQHERWEPYYRLLLPPLTQLMLLWPVHLLM